MRIVTILLFCAAAMFGADVTGNWKFEVQTDGGGGSPSFALKQNGEKLTGTYTGLFGTLPVNGSVKGDAIEIELDVTYEGTKGKVRYSGKIESAQKMSGKVVFENLGSGTFTATKQ